jgi:hypothetical protein
MFPYLHENEQKYHGTEVVQICTTVTMMLCDKYDAYLFTY